MNNLIIIILAIFFVQTSTFSQRPFIVSDKDTVDCAELKAALFLSKIVCFVKENPWEYTIDLDHCNLTLELGQQLLIPSLTNVRLINGSDITLTNDAKIIGDHYQTSKIVVGSEGNIVPPGFNTAINMSGCSGCLVSEITITAESHDENDNPVDLNVTGITIDDNSSENEISGVKFEEIDNGMIVNGDMNIFKDLNFFQVATDEGDCVVTTDDPFAIRLITSNSNSFTNIIHVRSIGAVTMWVEGECSDNIIYNISTEQEGSPCTDPSLYFDNILSTGNLIICNFNHGQTLTPDDIVICNNNNISDLGTGCMIQNIGIDCSGN